MADMSNQEKQIYRLIRWNRFWLFLFLFLAIAFAGLLYARSVLKDIHSLHVAWRGDALHVYSAKDGHFVITHLVKLSSPQGEYAAAQLPRPVTIIESRGHYFSKADIEGLEWIGISGEEQPPPAVGADVKVFYFIPKETESISGRKY